MSTSGDDRRGKRVVVGVGGGIAAYKTCGLIRLLTESGCHVDVVPTAAALKFVGAATFDALSGNPVSSDVFSDVPSVRHVALGQMADLVVIAPATADLLARAAAAVGARIAVIDGDRRLTYTALYARCRRLASGLAARGIGRLDTVAILAPNIPETHFALWGAQIAGRACPINYLLQPDHIAALLQAAAARELPGIDLELQLELPVSVTVTQPTGELTPPEPV